MAEAVYILQAIDEQIAQVEGGPELAVALGVSYDDARRTVKRDTGESLGSHIEKRRVDLMKRLLRTTTLQCGEIAQVVGYRRVETAFRAFKRRCGMTMSEYRSVIIRGRF
ncbi:MAG: helix-turn-helix domain-containing protein [Rhodothermales bacterium]|nr:helix-turn-helix domain-containing protein [Rhodothermales bacterium]MBO6780260.1 helix-turn-helix domain-containing protein [Rhodothermales bacterium]